MTEGSESTALRLCRGMMRVLGPEVGVVPGEAKLDELLPLERREHLWRQWEKASEVKLPALDHSMKVKMGWFTGGFVAALFLLSGLRLMGIPLPVSTIVGGIAGVLLGGVGLRLFGGKALEFPAGVGTIAELAARIEARER